MFHRILPFILLVGCSSTPITDRFEIKQTKQVTNIQACTKNKCAVQFEDDSTSFVKLPVFVGDQITFVWSKVSNMWLQVWN